MTTESLKEYLSSGRYGSSKPLPVFAVFQEPTQLNSNQIYQSSIFGGWYVLNPTVIYWGGICCRPSVSIMPAHRNDEKKGKQDGGNGIQEDIQRNNR